MALNFLIDQDADYRIIDHVISIIENVSFKGGKEHKEALSKIMLHKDKSNKGNFHLYDLLWIFTLQNGNVIGFMSNVDAEKILQRVSLTYKETYEKLTLFKEIGKEIT